MAWHFAASFNQIRSDFGRVQHSRTSGFEHILFVSCLFAFELVAPRVCWVQRSKYSSIRVESDCKYYSYEMLFDDFPVHSDVDDLLMA